MLMIDVNVLIGLLQCLSAYDTAKMTSRSLARRLAGAVRHGGARQGQRYDHNSHAHLWAVVATSEVDRTGG